jgi:F-type H+-transporting ATPase subunit delta
VSTRYPTETEAIIGQLYLYLLKRRKLKLLPIISRQLPEIAKEESLIKEVEVITAHPIDEKLRKQIELSLEEQGKRIQIREVVDPEILGGIILKYEDFVIDGSLRRYLESLKESV